HRHYMVVLFPLTLVWVARLAVGESQTNRQRGRRLLFALLVLQALLSVHFLSYVHRRQHIHGDFWKTYASQVQETQQARRKNADPPPADLLDSEQQESRDDR